MAKAYFIGGAPRVGKSSLAGMVLKAHPMAFAATDELRTTLRQTVTPDMQPALYHLDSLNADEADMARLMREQTADIVAAADAESEVVWPAVAAFIHDRLADGQDALVEGVAVLPHRLSELKCDYAAVFLGNQSPSHAQIIQDYASNHPGSWLGSLQPETIAAFATFTQACSTHIEREAHEYGQPYVELAGTSFITTLEQTSRRLLQ